ncbi:MAG: PEP-CTERM sorting domain-containing protein [Methylibium sp.]|uniref:PEP-CTERM sorting domain-containing protein n=1 Tax=Methylibium sp. TaxID=2067992 RepID=UPI00181AD3F5|nr:PEP-CTERM sorting domain-containing protein [Methylibium sp.]MBA3596965.1 PEP-CTERM sorting domain-containing protein [Methylibium sp.]
MNGNFHHRRIQMNKKFFKVAALAAASICSSAAMGGSIFLTGHDVDLHDGQNGFDNVILDYLRGSGTATAIAAGSYDIGVVRGASGSIGSVGVNTYEGFGTITVREMSSFASAADFSSFLSSVDVLAVSSHTSCGGCSFTDADSAALNSFSSQVTSFFNAGGDIYGNSGASLATYYDFLPPSAVASGLPIGGSSGFTATSAGTAIGISDAAPSMINGFPTHNRFTGFVPAFTVFENRGDEIISIGVRDARIGDGGVIVTPPNPIPEPETYALMLVGIGAVGWYTRRRRRTVRD